MTAISSDDVLERPVTLRNPFRIEALSWLSRLHRAAYRPRRRLAKRLVGRPAKALFDLLFRLGWGGGGSAFALRVGDEWRRVAFSARNTQFGALYLPQHAPVYEPETSALLDVLIGDDDVVFDVGANWGYYALFIASRDGFRGRVEAFEPFPPTFGDLARTVAEAGLAATIGVHDWALSDRDGAATMAAWDGVQSGLARLGAARSAGARRLEVPLRRLDSLALPDPAVIKIDAEDHEEAVLSGAGALLRRARPMVVFENWLNRATPRLTVGPLAVLADAGFRLFTIGWRRRGDGACVTPEPPAPADAGATLALVPFLPEGRFFLPEQLNILAVPEAKMDLLRRRFGSGGR